MAGKSGSSSVTRCSLTIRSGVIEFPPSIAPMGGKHLSETGEWSHGRQQGLPQVRLLLPQERLPAPPRVAYIGRHGSWTGGRVTQGGLIETRAVDRSRGGFLALSGLRSRVGAFLGSRSGIGDRRRRTLSVVRAGVRVRLARGTCVIAPGTRRTENGDSVRRRIRLVRPQIRRVSRLGGDPSLGRCHGQRRVRRRSRRDTRELPRFPLQPCAAEVDVGDEAFARVAAERCRRDRAETAPMARAATRGGNRGRSPVESWGRMG